MFNNHLGKWCNVFLMRKIYLLLFLCIYLIACTENNLKDECKVIDVKQHSFQKWEEFFRIENVIPLESSSSSLITVAAKCKVRGGLVFFQDFKEKSMFVFSQKNGKFKYEIGKLGYSESEHKDFLDFNYDEENSRITILDERGLASFDAKNGKFIDRKKSINGASVDYCRFLIQGNDTLLYSPDMDFTVSRLSNGGKTDELRKSKGFQMQSERFFSLKGNILVLPDYGCFTIDTYRNGGILPKYILDFGRETLPSKYIPKDYEEFDKTDNMNPYFKSVQQCIENSKWLYVLVVGPKQTYYNVFFDKQNEKVYAGKMRQDLGLTLVDADETGFWGLVYPSDLSRKSIFYKQLKEQVQESQGNPLLIKLKINM